MPIASAQDVVLEIIRQADSEWIGKTKLFKAFYFAHLYYGAECPGLLTDWPIARMPQGPGIHKSDELFASLFDGGLLTCEIVHDEGPYPEYRYRLTTKGGAMAPLPSEAIRAIEKAVAFCKDKTGSQLSQITHERSRSWNESKNGDILNIDIDLIPEEEYTKRQAELRRLESTLTGLFDGASA